MSDSCKLKAAHDTFAHCDEERCVYWQAVDHLAVSASADGCAIQHFQLLGGDSGAVASWLLSVKERVEGTARHVDA